MRLLVAGLINIETTLKVSGFPIEYNPVHYPFFGIASTVSGVAYNVTKALTVLGAEVNLLSVVGSDHAEPWVRQNLASLSADDRDVLALLGQTCQSVILYDSTGRRQVNADIKNIQECVYPLDRFRQRMKLADACLVGNLNFARPFLAEARAAGKLVACDVHTVADLQDAYNGDFMRAANLLFMSHERLPVPPEEWAQAVLARYAPEVLVIGMGAGGALLATRSEGIFGRFPARVTRPIVSTIGAGDALFSCFVETFLRTRDARLSLRRAIAFASWKIGVASASEGFPDTTRLDALSNDDGESQLPPASM